MPGDFRCDRGDYARMLVLFCMRGCGCIVRPAFPAPSIIEGHCLAKLGRIAPRECGVMKFFTSLRGANGSRECAPDDRLHDEAIHSFLGAAPWIASLAL